MNPICKTYWEKEPRQGWKCQTQNCTLKYDTYKKLQKQKRHRFQPETNPNRSQTTGAQGLRKPDRRKPLQEGTPPGKLTYENKAPYDPDRKTMEVYDMRNNLPTKLHGGHNTTRLKTHNRARKTKHTKLEPINRGAALATNLQSKKITAIRKSWTAKPLKPNNANTR